MLLAAIKQREIDERIELNEVQILAVVEKLIRQRNDSVRQFSAAGRQDLATKEQAEIDLLTSYLPAGAALSETELLGIVDQAIASTAATSMRDMGKVMAILKPQVAGRADLSQVSALVKQRLST